MEPTRIVVKCCDCQRVKQDDGWWDHDESKVPVDRVYSHSYCPACLAKASAMIEALDVCVG